ncbi:MAG: ZIP family metal transporter [Bacteroidetes bacterium]|nr:ZIP family metal transporter [Bacteroidota bacterium]
MTTMLMISALIFIPAFLVGILVLQKPLGKRSLGFMLAFSGSFLLSITITHLLPEVFHEHQHWLGAAVLAGFFVQIIFDVFSGGVDHGHVEMAHHHHHAHTGKQSLSLWAVLPAVYLHGLVEGIPLYYIPSYEHPLVLAIAFHSVPVVAVFANLLRSQGISLHQRLILVALFALMPIIGMLLGGILSQSNGSFWALLFPALAAGIFLNMATTILLESGHEHHYKWRRLMFILAGLVLGLIFHLS